MAGWVYSSVCVLMLGGSDSSACVSLLGGSDSPGCVLLLSLVVFCGWVDRTRQRVLWLGGSESSSCSCFVAGWVGCEYTRCLNWQGGILRTDCQPVILLKNKPPP